MAATTRNSEMRMAMRMWRARFLEMRKGKRQKKDRKVGD